LTGIVGVGCLLKVREYKGELIDSDDEEEVIRSIVFSSFSLGKERAGETYIQEG